MSEREVGHTLDAGWEIGVSRTVPHPPEAVWALLTSAQGLAIWLGDGVATVPEPGAAYETTDGTVGEGRSLHDRDRVRLTWRPRTWTHDTTLQLTVSPARTGTLLRIHQERLADADERGRQRERWRDVVTRLAAALDADPPQLSTPWP